MPYLELDATRIAFDDTGGDGPVVVFSHGILMDREMFAPQVAALRAEFRCIAWDERGHGDTVTQGSWDYWDSGRDLIALLDHLAVDHAFLVGMSQGGFLSLRAALLAPERVRGLVFIDSQAGPEDPEKVPLYQMLLDQWLADGPADHILDAIAAMIVAPADEEPWRAKWTTRTPRDWVVEPFNTLVGREDLHDRLGEVTAPALVIHGDADPSIPMEKAEALCAGLPGCEGIVRVAGGGHAANLSHPGVVTEAIRDFCRRHSG